MSPGSCLIDSAFCFVIGTKQGVVRADAGDTEPALDNSNSRLRAQSLMQLQSPSEPCVKAFQCKLTDCNGRSALSFSATTSHISGISLAAACIHAAASLGAAAPKMASPRYGRLQGSEQGSIGEDEGVEMTRVPSQGALRCQLPSQHLWALILVSQRQS